MLRKPGQGRLRKEPGNGVADIIRDLRKASKDCFLSIIAFFHIHLEHQPRETIPFTTVLFFSSITHLQFHLFYQAGKNRTGILSDIL